MTQFLSRRTLLGTGAALLAAPGVLRAQGALPKLRYTLDWALQGPNAHTLLARDKGFFREAGVEATVDRGFGSGRVPVDIAGGAYDMGQSDINTVIKFIAENPSAGLVVCGIWGDASLLSATVRADGPIRTPKDLEGKTLAAPESDAGRQLFPAFAKAAGIDASKITWMTVNPELREPMLVQRRADGITGLSTSTGLSLKALGMDWPQQRILYYREAGLQLYGTAFLTTRGFIQRNPEAAKAGMKALFRGLVYANANRAECIANLKRVESLTDVAIETERQAVAFDQMMITDNTRRNGIGAVDTDRLTRAVRIVEEAYGLAPKLKVEDVYTDVLLPPAAERML
ncbi:ABC transporter substrate-binding protein [Roseomonas sp. BN140053]|uniref:ABC transporter substrate-binding protein n=1 Tax=Roseomonas sp. BN140053 TaxID=3391898 RepID=UPI0039E8489D